MPVTRQDRQTGPKRDEQGALHRNDKNVGRKVRFAPGPLAAKYRTEDGHPDREGRIACPKRSLGLSWGHDLTPSSIKELETQLGEECRPSLDRLKRRLGLLPLRKRPMEYLSWMIDSSSDSSNDDEVHSPAKKLKPQQGKRQRQQPVLADADEAALIQPPTSDNAGTVPNASKRKKWQSAIQDSGAIGSGGAAGVGTVRIGSALWGRKPRQKEEVENQRIPASRIPAGLAWRPPKPLKRSESTQPQVEPGSPADTNPAVTVTFNRKVCKQAQHSSRSIRSSTFEVGNMGGKALASIAAVADMPAPNQPVSKRQSSASQAVSRVATASGTSILPTNGALMLGARQPMPGSKHQQKSRRLGRLGDPFAMHRGGLL